MSMSSNVNVNNGRVKEIPKFIAADIDQDFGPNLPLVLQQLISSWLLSHPAVAQQDMDPERVAVLTRDEIDEARKAHNNKGETKHLITEVADTVFFLNSFLFGLILVSNGHIPELDNHKIHTQSLTTGVGSGVYERLEGLSGDLEMGGEKSIPALEEMYAQALALWRELSFLGAPIPVMNWVAEIKNTRNFPVEAGNGLDPFTGKILLPHEADDQHDHSRAALKILRIADGKKESGLDPTLYYMYRYYVLNFRDSEVMLSKLRQELALAASNGYLNGVK